MTHRRRDRAGFTLIELLVVLGLIIMVSAIALPNIATIIRANADAQAHNLMSALIKSARITAMQDGLYAGVHQELANVDSPSNRRLAGSSFAAVLTTYSVRSLNNIYVDNTQVDAPPGWVLDTTLTGQYGADYLHDNNVDNGLTTVVFQPELTQSSGHDVYMRWPEDGGNANDVPVTVFHIGGSTDYTVNQQTNGGRWVLLGRHDCAPGVGRVEVNTDGTSGRVIADAVRFVPIIEVSNFTLAAGQTPKRIPGTMVFGEVKAPEGTSPGTYVGGSYNAEGVGGLGNDVEPGSSNDIHAKDFTTFSLIFTPLGGLTCKPNQQDVYFANDEYVPGQSALFGGSNPLWSLNVANADSDGDGEIGEPGARVITMFDYATFSKRLGDDRVTFLNQTAQLMPINVLLGMLVERQ